MNKNKNPTKLERFIQICMKKFIEIIVDIPENPGFFSMFLIGFFGFFEATNEGIPRILFGEAYSETVQALMFGVGFWGMISSVMLDDKHGVDDPDNDYWINFWLLSHIIKFVIFLLLAWKIALSYGVTRIAVYVGLIVIDLVIINKAIHEAKVLKNKRALLNKINK